MASVQGVPNATARPAPHSFGHLVEEHCPLCDQPIPPEKFEEIHGRIQAKERERSVEAERHLREQVALEKANAEAKARADLEQVRKENSAALEKAKQDAEAKEAAAREEARQAAEKVAAERIAEIEKAKAAAEQVAKEHQEAFAKATREAAAKEAAAREEARKAAEAAAATKIAEMELARKLAEQQAKDKQEELEKAKLEAVAKESAAREEARKITEAELAPKLAEAEEAKKIAEQKLQTATAAQESTLAQRLTEQREALEKANVEALNAEKAKSFNEKLKVEEELKAVTRRLEQKTAEDLGEGAEINLFESLKGEYEEDKIVRVEKGAAGADIIHDVLHNGMICGRIIYDSKNRNAWRNEYVTKLRQDQLAAGGDHAILSSHVFPAGTKQIHVQDSVLIANPARVLVLVELLRKQIILVHSLRLSNEAREQKTGQLYDFITSERASQLLDHINARADEMLDLDVKEKKVHDATWKKRGELVRLVQRAHADFTSEIGRIVGTAGEGPE